MPADKVKAKGKSDEGSEETANAPEEAQDDSAASQEGAEGATEGDQAGPDAGDTEPSAADLQAQLEAKDAEIARLKASQAPATEPAATTGEGTIRDLSTQSFFRTTLPQFQQTFEDEKATSTQKAAAVYDMTNKLVGAVLTDQIHPVQITLATALCQTTNEVELLTLKLEDPGFKTVEKDVRAELEKADWSARSKLGAVREIYYKIRGRAGNGAVRPAVVPDTSKVRQAIRDVSAGSGTAPTRGASAGLSPAQEADRQALSAEGGTEMPSKIYFTKLKARQDKIKAENEGKPVGERRRIPQTLSEF